MSNDEQAIRNLQQVWMQASENGDIDRVLELMTDDVVFLTPDRPPFGRAEFAAQSKAGQGVMKVSARAEMEEVFVSGDIAYARSKFAITLTRLSDGQQTKLAGHGLTIFRRGSDGAWLVTRDANLVQPVR